MSASPRAGALLASLALYLAVPLASAQAAEWDKYAVESVSSSLSTTQAGAHADFTIDFELTSDGGQPWALTRDVHVEAPPGVTGNPQGIRSCTIAQLGKEVEESECPISSQVGVSEVKLAGGSFIEPVYNMEPPGGDIVARFGFYAGPFPTLINVRVDPLDFGLIASVEGASAAAAFVGAETTFWGVPADPIHDALRLTPEEANKSQLPPGGRPAGVPKAPFMTNPTDCSTKREVSVTALSYQLPDSPSTKAGPFPQISGCGKVAFEPSFTLTPTNPEAAAPTGLDATLTIPQNESATGLGASALKSAVVTLPEGMAINPAAADGLEACSAQQVRLATNQPAECPDAAKLGSVEVEVPALERTLKGALYQRTPEPGRLFGLWLVTDEQGVHLKLAGEIEADPETGRLTTRFNGIPALGGLPQVPFSEMRLHVFGGPRAPLSTPSRCGTYQAHFSFVPWSGKAPVQGDAAMQIATGCEKGGFSPKLSAGTRKPFAGAFSPFALILTRQDGEANPEHLSVTLPKGLLAKLGGVELCPEAQVATGACPASSQVGKVTVATGVGTLPLWVPQPGKSPTALYLAGPYKGAPYSLLAKVPAQAGPFDLGTVVSRAAIEVDPRTAQVTATTDPLPQILAGVPVSYRTIHVDVDRPNFTLNPTGCSPKAIEASLTAGTGETSTPTAPFHIGRCAKLGFKPRLSLQLKGGTKRGDNPALRSVYRPRAGDANLKRLTLRLPRSAFLDQAHIGTICTRVQFAAAEGHGSQCPKGSVYGHARAFTPLLSEPLSGPVYLRSSDNDLPDLVLALKGPIEIEASARIDSHKGGIRATFRNLPDAPITKVLVNMQGGAKGLIQNSANLCGRPNRAEASFAAHNGRRANGRPPVRAAGCRK